uniref:Olfactory receptor n=1 Tax=Apteryx owenii TaxID=8824 RepID=A0A8B9Q996_APTOW
MQNQTTPIEFILLGFSMYPELHFLLSVVIPITYIFTLMGNVFIIFIITVEPHLQTPMYFFLGNLSLFDICQTTTIVPQMLLHLFSGANNISYTKCMVQLYFFILFVGAEGLLLAAMAYDRFLAICNPLRYTVLMDRKACSMLVMALWLTTALNASVHTALTVHLPFCGPSKINYFYCDVPPLLALSCGDLSLNTTVLLVASVVMGWGPSICIVLSYVYIVCRVLKMSSSQERAKAFSTCASHLSVVLLYFGSCLFTYIRPMSSYSLDRDKLISLLYSILTPMLNPVIYTLRNKDVKRTL